jgi:hypothetical protein
LFPPMHYVLCIRYSVFALRQVYFPRIVSLGWRLWRLGRSIGRTRRRIGAWQHQNAALQPSCRHVMDEEDECPRVWVSSMCDQPGVVVDILLSYLVLEPHETRQLGNFTSASSRTSPSRIAKRLNTSDWLPNSYLSKPRDRRHAAYHHNVIPPSQMQPSPNHHNMHTNPSRLPPPPPQAPIHLHANDHPLRWLDLPAPHNLPDAHLSLNEGHQK